MQFLKYFFDNFDKLKIAKTFHLFKIINNFKIKMLTSS